MTNDIILKAKMDLIDHAAREMIATLEQRIQTINERTKIHTLDIRKLKGGGK